MQSHLRAAAHRTFVRALSATGALGKASRTLAEAGLPIVLTLHRIVPDAELEICRSPRGMVLRESLFRELLAYLTDVADVLSPYDITYGPSARTRPRVMLTFDDGWADNAEIALPHLTGAGVEACFFVATALVGRAHPFWPERVQSLLDNARRLGRTSQINQSLQRLESTTSGKAPQAASSESDEAVLTWLKQFAAADLLSWADDAEASLSSSNPSPANPQMQDGRERMMTWDQLRELLAAGHSLGSHTDTHALLPGLSPQARWRELVDSRDVLEQQLVLRAGEIAGISYPNGWASEGDASAAAEAGYRLGFTTAVGVCRATANQMLLPRINVWDGTLTRPDGRFCEKQLGYALFWRPLHARAETSNP